MQATPRFGTDALVSNNQGEDHMRNVASLGKLIVCAAIATVP